MILNKETIYKKDLDNRKIYVTRDFEAPVEKVWKAWTEPGMLDQWWAPRPWKANTVSMDFSKGGRWFYFMEGPDGSKHYAMIAYNDIVPNSRFEGIDAFCDEKGNINTEFPSMSWIVKFKKAEEGTRVEVEILFKSVEDINKIVEMGFEEGFAMAHNNLDELLAK